MLCSVPYSAGDEATRSPGEVTLNSLPQLSRYPPWGPLGRYASFRFQSLEKFQTDTKKEHTVIDIFFLSILLTNEL
jgi:hypothetical protein